MLNIRKSESELDEEFCLRSGPATIDEAVKATEILFQNEHLLIISKPADVRMDGKFDITVQTICERIMPLHKDIFRWCHQLDYATSGVLAVGLSHAGASATCQLFQNRRTKKEYLAIVRGHIPFGKPFDSSKVEEGEFEERGGEGRVYISPEKMQSYKLEMELMNEKTIKRNNKINKGRVVEVKSEDDNVPCKPRPAGFWFTLKQNEIRRRKKAGESLSEYEGTILSSNWKVVKNDEILRQIFYQESIADQLRYRNELSARKSEVESMEILNICVEVNKEEYLEKNLLFGLGSLHPKNRNVESLPLTYEGHYIITLPVAECPPPDFRMEIGSLLNPGKPSLTELVVLKHGIIDDNPVTKVLLKPHSGRRHQLRLHTMGIGHPIMGDATYGVEQDLEYNEHTRRMALHAFKLSLPFNSKDSGKLKEPIFVQAADRFESFDYL